MIDSKINNNTNHNQNGGLSLPILSNILSAEYVISFFVVKDGTAPPFWSFGFTLLLHTFTHVLLLHHLTILFLILLPFYFGTNLLIFKYEFFKGTGCKMTQQQILRYATEYMIFVFLYKF